MAEAVIIDGARSPIGMKNGKMIGIRPDDLTAQVVKGLMERNPDVSVNRIRRFRCRNRCWGGRHVFRPHGRIHSGL